MDLYDRGLYEHDGAGCRVVLELLRSLCDGESVRVLLGWITEIKVLRQRGHVGLLKVGNFHGHIHDFKDRVRRLQRLVRNAMMVKQARIDAIDRVPCHSRAP